MTISKRASFRSLLLAATMLASPLIAAAPTTALAQVAVGISVQLPPPVLPVYEQPPMPDVGYMWTPGYWAWAAPVGYYWVPGTWVQPPMVGVLWTPPYWGWVNGAYVFNAGYWGPHIGFYGGINYGFGYGGHGYNGGHWDHGAFAYNRSVNNFGAVHVTNVYSRNVAVVNRTNVSFAGGTGGIHAVPSAAERAAMHESHVQPTAEQARHIDAAAHNPDFAASHNNGHPAVAATSRPAEFAGPGVTHEHPAGVAHVAHRPAPHPAGAAQVAHKPPPHPAGAQAANRPPHPAHPPAAEEHKDEKDKN